MYIVYLTNMKSIQQQCAERLYELLPHKKELGFGCEVKIKDYPRIHDVFMVVDITNHLNGERTCRITGFNDYFEADELEIIGQPIRLADILLALSKVGAGVNYTFYAGCFYKVDLHSQIYSLCVEYNLEKDNILDQSDETAQFICDILS